ncbi:hypothetical protein [Geobacter sp.]|uniref:hypothetical protein n=1 Tax=Geobacter sp. TaxID=46610 RepID=UPI002620BCD1|nr:hypothetical protein [Geobacter sp.]
MKWTSQHDSTPQSARLPDTAEIVANLWYVMDNQGFIYSLRIKPYVCGGSDEVKLAFLKSRAYLDYLIARPFSVPQRFCTTIVEGDGSETTYAVIHHDDAIRLGGIDQLFFEGLDELQKDLPAQTELKIPESPLIKVTALTVDENGKIVPCDALRGQDSLST